VSNQLGKSEEPALVFVASDRHRLTGESLYTNRLRYAIYTARHVCNWPFRIVVMDIGLTQDQRDALNAEDVALVGVGHGTVNKLREPFMWKIWADLRLCYEGPIIMADADLEFRDTDVLIELLEIARSGKFFICEEEGRWYLPMVDFNQVTERESEAFLYVMQEYGGLPNTRILNAGLFGGPRPLFDGMMKLVRSQVAAITTFFNWYWEQLALSYLCRNEALSDKVKILPSTYNWLPVWGLKTPGRAKVIHFISDRLADRRTPIPMKYLRPALHRLPPTRSEDDELTAGVAVRGAKLLSTD